MDHLVLIQLFDATFNPDAAIRKSAEQELRKVSNRGWCIGRRSLTCAV